MKNTGDTRNRFYRHLAQTSEEPLGLEVSHAEGPWIHTTDGRRYIDFISGIAVSSLGHRHPSVIEAIRRQVDRHLHVMVYGEFIQQPQAQLAALLAERLPNGLDQVYLTNSGTEANEGALKLARKYTGRRRYIAFHNGFHGDTLGSLSVTGRPVYREPYEPLLQDVTFAGFNDPQALDAVDRDTAAVIMEPIQGEGGVIEADRQWLTELRRRCDETGSLLIFDEIQTGFGRTGALFAMEHYDVTPDIVTMAKAMGGGMPIGGFAASSEVFSVFRQDPPLNHVTTFGGHPVSAAAAHAQLRELTEGPYVDRARQIEQRARRHLEGPGIVELRGRGAMLGLQLQDFGQTRQVVQQGLEEGILLGWTLHSNTLIRLAPPLVIDDELLDRVLAFLNEAAGRYRRE